MATCKLLDKLLQLLHVSAAVVHQVAVPGALLGASSLPTSAVLAALCPAWPPEGTSTCLLHWCQCQRASEEGHQQVALVACMIRCIG
jgi:hypothetical protein